MYIYEKEINSDKLTKEIIDAGLTGLQYINTIGNEVNIFFENELSQQQIETLDQVVANHLKFDIPTQKQQVESIVRAAREFGNTLIDEFAAENVILGITQDNMTGSVRKTMSEVTAALITGSLYDAIDEIRNIPLESRDNKYVTEARMLQFVNKIESFLGAQLSLEL